MLVGPAFMNWAEKHLEEPITDLGNLLENFTSSKSPSFLQI
jgi:hypothetical protein